MTLHEDVEWRTRWEERGSAVRKVLGDTYPPGEVVPFSWKEYMLPGACVLTFAPRLGGDSFLYMTLGLTQPLRPTDRAYPWELSIRTREHADWPIDLLYQLVTQWLWEKGDMWFGYHLPLRFFVGGDGKVWASVSERVRVSKVVGSVRGLYLWTDAAQLAFQTKGGDFGLLVVVGVTEDEEHIVEEASPAHLMLLFHRMRVGQVCDPYRRCVLSLPGARSEWESIRRMSHDDALGELQHPRQTSHACWSNDSCSDVY